MGIAALPAVDLTVNVSGPSSANPGTPFTYTMTISENSLTASDGATFTNTPPAGATNVRADCAASAGAVCPVALNVSNATVSGTIVAMPHLGVVTLTVTGRFGNPSASSVTDVGHVDPPEGTTDSDPGSNDSVVSTVIATTTDLALTLTQSSDTIGVDSPNTYTATLSNLGPTAADGATWYSWASATGSASSPFTKVDIEVESCTGTGGVECPGFIADQGGNSYLYWYGTLGAFPAGAVLTVVYRIVPSPGEPGCGTENGGISGSSSITAPGGVTDTDANNNYASYETVGTPVQPCATAADLAVTVTAANETIGVGSPNTYTATVSNQGPDAADGANWYLNTGVSGSGVGPFATFDVKVLSCTGTGGVDCPSFIADQSETSSLYWYGNLATFPAQAVLTVVFRITPTPTGQPPCGEVNGGIAGGTSIQAPAGVTDTTPDNNLNFGSEGVKVPTCPPTDLAVTLTQANPTIGIGSPNTYTVTVANNGPTDADGAYWNQTIQLPDGAAGSFQRFDLDVSSCTGTGGVECPSWVYSQSQTSFGYWSGSLGAFPAGAVLTVVYVLRPLSTGPAACGSASAGIRIDNYLSAPIGVGESSSTDNNRSSSTPSLCHDISVNQTVSPTSAQAGEPVSFASTVRSSGGGGPARDVVFTDALPRGFVFAEASCSSPDPESACGDVVYDSTTRVVSSTIPVLGDLAAGVTILITGTAGVIPGTYTNTVTAQSGSGEAAFVDPVPASNASTVSLQVFNTAATIVITKTLSGLPTEGLAADLRFTGEISCGTQGAKPWALTVRAGSSSAVAPGVLFYGGESCTITEEPAAPPKGYYLETVIEPDTIALLPSSGTVDVAITTALSVSGALSIDSSTENRRAERGGTASYDLTVENTGTTDAVGFDVTALLPPGLTYVSGTPGGSVNGQTITWTNLALSAGQTRTFTVTASVDLDAPSSVTVAFGITPPPRFDPTAVSHGCAEDDAQSCVTTRVFTIGVNSPPVAVDDELVTVDHLACITLDVLANDTDPDGDELTILAASASNGTVEITKNTLSYCPEYRWKGLDVVTYSVSDGSGGEDEAEAQVSTNNAPPEAAAYYLDTFTEEPVSVDLLSNTTDVNGDVVRVTGIGSASSGTVELGDDEVTAVYTPNTGFAGSDSFRYRIGDGDGGSVVETVYIYVARTIAAADDRTSTPQGVPVTVDVLDNDTAGDRATLDPTSLVLVDPADTSQTTKQLRVAGVGRYDVGGDGRITFSPLPSFTGTAEVTYQITERSDIEPSVVARPRPRTATAELTITVAALAGPVEPPPMTDPPPVISPTTPNGPDLSGGSGSGSTSAGLASTGGPSPDLLALGSALLLLGWALVLVGRRRSRS